MWLLGGIFIAAILAFVFVFFGLLWAYDSWRDRYHARRRHVLHTTAADERIVAEHASMERLRARPPWWARPRRVYHPPAQVQHVAPDTPRNGNWLHPAVIDALGHATVDELIDSIVMRALAPD